MVESDNIVLNKKEHSIKRTKPIELLDDSFYDMFNGSENFYGRNDSFLNKKIQKLENEKNRSVEQQNELEKSRVEMGLNTEGQKKPPVCWNYVNTGRCIHTSYGLVKCYLKSVNGFEKNNKWHPGNEELQYLRNKKK